MTGGVSICVGVVAGVVVCVCGEGVGGGRVRAVFNIIYLRKVVEGGVPPQCVGEGPHPHQLSLDQSIGVSIKRRLPTANNANRKQGVQFAVVSINNPARRANHNEPPNYPERYLTLIHCSIYLAKKRISFVSSSGMLQSTSVKMALPIVEKNISSQAST